jgi:hypothetical protein
MSTDEQGPADGAAGHRQEQEGRALLLRLLRLVAAEVAAQFTRPGSAEPAGRESRDTERPPGSNRSDRSPAAERCPRPHGPPAPGERGEGGPSDEPRG